MGRSNSIEQQQKSNDAFNAYIDSMSADLGKKLESERQKIDSLIEQHYKPFPDKAELLLGSYQHLSTISEWSLDSVNNILDGCRRAIFGAPAPKGVVSDQSKPEVTASINEIKERELYIANAAFEVVQGALSSFTNKTTTSVMLKTDVKNLSPGLTLFITVMENSYSRKDFFRNESIIQNLFYFKVYYSIKEGQQTSKLSDLKAYEDQKATFRKLMQKQNDKLLQLDFDDPNFELLLQKAEGITAHLDRSLQEIDKKIKALSTDNSVDKVTLLNLVHNDFDGNAIINNIQKIKHQYRLTKSS